MHAPVKKVDGLADVCIFVASCISANDRDRSTGIAVDNLEARVDWHQENVKKYSEAEGSHGETWRL